MKKIFILMTILTLASCSGSEDIIKYKYEKIDNEKMATLMQEKEYIVIDVRSKEEFSGFHIKDAINISHDKINEAILPTAEIIFVYCASGTRSKIAAEELLKLGYEVYDLGGIDNIELEKE